MIYKCQKCQFLFSRIEPPTKCPDCGKEHILKANEKEQQEYEKFKEEFDEPQ